MNLRDGDSVARHTGIKKVHRGDGHTVMIIPGFTADDRSTRSLRNYLGGYHQSQTDSCPRANRKPAATQ